MSEAERLPIITVKEKQSGRIRVINLVDFDEAIHESATAPTTDEFDRQVGLDALRAAGIEHAKNISNKKIQELLEGMGTEE